MTATIIDDLSWLDPVVGRDWLNDVRAAWPADGWFQYDAPEQKKRTLADWRLIPPPCRRVLSLLATTFARSAIADLSLWGAGLCEMRPGDYLGEHLDHDVHPHLGLRRAHNAILFLDDGCGGDLILGRGPAALRVRSACGRVCLFETTEDAWHQVEPAKFLRRTLSIYFYDPGEVLNPERARRPRAAFQIGTCPAPSAGGRR